MVPGLQDLSLSLPEIRCSVELQNCLIPDVHDELDDGGNSGSEKNGQIYRAHPPGETLS